MMPGYNKIVARFLKFSQNHVVIATVRRQWSTALSRRRECEGLIMVARPIDRSARNWLVKILNQDSHSAFCYMFGSDPA